MPALSAAEEVLRAAIRLTKRYGNEFTEWDLTVETWKQNKNRWGLPGYEDEYPNHKRVMNEIMARGTEKAAVGWLERTRMNHYRVTSAGFARAATMESKETDSRPRASIALYDNVEEFAFHRVFEDYLRDHSEPKTWIGAAAFLSLSKQDSETLERQMKRVTDAIGEALAWMDETRRNEVRRGDSGQIITRERLVKLREFVIVLQERFAPQYAAIKAKGTGSSRRGTYSKIPPSKPGGRFCENKGPEPDPATSTSWS
jgi:hypothetical protein